MSLVAFLVTVLGLIILSVLISIVVFIGLLILAVYLIKKHPVGALFTFFIIYVIAIAQTLDPVTIVAGVIELVTATIVLITQFKRLKKALR